MPRWKSVELNRRPVIKCAKCGGRIKPGEEVKVGFINKKYYHAKCYSRLQEHK